MRTAGLRSIVLVLTVALAASSGCGDGGLVPLVPVEGQVFWRDRPVADALVMLHPRTNDPRIERMNPRGRTDAEGKFKLKTYDDNDGAPAGEYAVTIFWFEGDVDRLAGRYADAETTTLHITISPETPLLEPIVLP
jgi:hypothetical protein